jgi:hypothetical protein
MPIAAFAVLAINNEFDWKPAFQTLGMDASNFERARTLDRYFS